MRGGRSLTSLWGRLTLRELEVTIDIDITQITITPESGFTLSVTGWAGEIWPAYPGHYSLTEEQHNGRPVYRNSGGPRARHLWSQEDGTWAVSGNVGYDLPGMKSTDAAVSPGLCQQWQYMDRSDDYKYKPCDITVTTINN